MMTPKNRRRLVPWAKPSPESGRGARALCGEGLRRHRKSPGRSLLPQGGTSVHMDFSDAVRGYYVSKRTSYMAFTLSRGRRYKHAAAVLRLPLSFSLPLLRSDER